MLMVDLRVASSRVGVLSIPSVITSFPPMKNPGMYVPGVGYIPRGRGGGLYKRGMYVLRKYILCYVWIGTLSTHYITQYACC